MEEKSENFKLIYLIRAQVVLQRERSLHRWEAAGPFGFGEVRKSLNYKSNYFIQYSMDPHK